MKEKNLNNTVTLTEQQLEEIASNMTCSGRVVYLNGIPEIEKLHNVNLGYHGPIKPEGDPVFELYTDKQLQDLFKHCIEIAPMNYSEQLKFNIGIETFDRDEMLQAVSEEKCPLHCILALKAPEGLFGPRFCFKLITYEENRWLNNIQFYLEWFRKHTKGGYDDPKFIEEKNKYTEIINKRFK